MPNQVNEKESKDTALTGEISASIESVGRIQTLASRLGRLAA